MILAVVIAGMLTCGFYVRNRSWVPSFMFGYRVLNRSTHELPNVGPCSEATTTLFDAPFGEALARARVDLATEGYSAGEETLQDLWHFYRPNGEIIIVHPVRRSMDESGYAATEVILWHQPNLVANAWSNFWDRWTKTPP